LFNQDDKELKKFAFKIFDINNDGKLSENDLYDLMQLTSSNKIISLQEKGKDILTLKKRESDLFIDIFWGDFNKIS
jgi:Ca2+-binding EF-hand superfamily protein